MIYEFAADDGTVIERDLPMSEAPALGSVITVGGVRYRRIASEASTPRKQWRPYVSHRLPRNLKVPGTDIKCTADGKPCIETQAQERSAAAFLGWERE